MGVIDESEIFSASRVNAVAAKHTDKVFKTVRIASDPRCWPTFAVCLDRCKGTANDRIADSVACEYVEVVALHADMAARKALEKCRGGHVIDVLCIHPGNFIKVS